MTFPTALHSFIPGLKPPFSANPSHRSPSFFFFRIHYMDSPDCLLLFLSISILYFLVFLFLHFLVVGCHVGFRAHVKIASRIVSYRISPMVDGSQADRLPMQCANLHMLITRARCHAFAMKIVSHILYQIFVFSIDTFRSKHGSNPVKNVNN